MANINNKAYHNGKKMNILECIPRILVVMNLNKFFKDVILSDYFLHFFQHPQNSFIKCKNLSIEFYKSRSFVGIIKVSFLSNNRKDQRYDFSPVQNLNIFNN